MLQLERQIAERVDAFVAELSAIIRKAALQSASEILAEQAREPSESGRGSSRNARGKRSPEALDAVAEDLVAAITANPGQRIEELATQLGLPSRELALPARKLLASRIITRKGERRATRYYPGKSRRKARGRARGRS
jgi:hypothetical protein